MHISSVKLIDEDINELFDSPADIINYDWNEQAIFNKLMDSKETLVCDALLDQQLFAGVGNVIKNEVLHQSGIHPLSKIGGINRFKLQQLIRDTHNFLMETRKWEKHGILQVNWKVHRQDLCPKHELPLKVKTLGKMKRKTYYCEKCQTLYI